QAGGLDDRLGDVVDVDERPASPCGKDAPPLPDRGLRRPRRGPRQVELFHISGRIEAVTPTGRANGQPGPAQPEDIRGYGVAGSRRRMVAPSRLRQRPYRYLPMTTQG